MIGSRRLRRLLAGGTAAAIACATALIGASTPASAANNATLTMSTDQISTLNPFINIDDSALLIIGSIYPSLDNVQPDGTVKPFLADSWTTSPDKLTWTFKIHSGLKWSDGKPITAKDAAWTFNTIMTNKVAATANGSLVADFAKVSAPNDTTLVITTKQPKVNLLNVSTPYTGIQIMPQHVWQSKVSGNLKAFTNTPGSTSVVSYGPYQVTQYKTDQYTTLEANKDFFQGAPKFGKIVLQYFKNQDAIAQALQSGQVDIDQSLTATQYQALKGKAGITTNQLAPTHWVGIEINSGAKSSDGKLLKTNTANPILADPKVRQAIAYGIDKPTLVKKVLLGLGNVGEAYVPPAYPQWKWQPSPSQLISFNQAKANQILDAAGYPKGSDGIRKDTKTGKPLSFRLGTHSDDNNDGQIANYLVGWMKDIGIKLDVQAQSYAALNGNLAKGDWDILMDGWNMGTSDPTYNLSIQTCAVLPKADGSGGNTDAFFCDPKYDQLYAKQLTQFNQADRAKTIGQMQSILYNANCDIMLYNDNLMVATRSDKVKGFYTGTANASGVLPLQNTFHSLTAAEPVGSSDDSGGGSSTGVIIGVVVAIVVVVLVVGFFVLRRRSTAAERE